MHMFYTQGRGSHENSMNEKERRKRMYKGKVQYPQIKTVFRHL